MFLTEAPVALHYEAPARQNSSLPGFLRIPLFIITTILSTPSPENLYDDDDGDFGFGSHRSRHDASQERPWYPELPPQFTDSIDERLQREAEERRQRLERNSQYLLERSRHPNPYRLNDFLH